MPAKFLACSQLELKLDLINNAVYIYVTGAQSDKNATSYHVAGDQRANKANAISHG